VSETARSYIPAAGRDWLLPFYDPLQWLLGGHGMRRAMLDAAALRPGLRVLDVGCGTGSLVAELARSRPEVEVTGLDPDPLALARARRKLERAGVEARLDEGFADDLPYPEASFDRVFSSFMFHHLSREVKEGMLREVSRVLAPGGALHLLDFGGEAPAHGLLAHLVHRHDDVGDNFGGGIARLLRQAGFGQVREVWSRRTLFGRVTHYAAPDAQPGPPAVGRGAPDPSAA
jgi:ubiquinone/menaquinone biosynthesis C-methylase UbiE